MKKHLTVVA